MTTWSSNQFGIAVDQRGNSATEGAGNHNLWKSPRLDAVAGVQQQDSGRNWSSHHSFVDHTFGQHWCCCHLLDKLHKDFREQVFQCLVVDAGRDAVGEHHTWGTSTCCRMAGHSRIAGRRWGIDWEGNNTGSTGWPRVNHMPVALAVEQA